MRTGLILFGALALVASSACIAATGAAQVGGARRLSRAVLEDKVRGGWAGQMIGVSYGAATEFKAMGKTFDGEIKWWPEMVKDSLQQDDLYVEMTFAEVMDTVGLDATAKQYGEMFTNSRYQLWHANAGARRLLNHGISAPQSGEPQFNVHADDIDFQIESDFIGLMSPGLPQESNKYANRVGRVMNAGDGLYGGMFFGAMYAAAYFETDPRQVVEQGLRAIPAASGYGRIIRDTLDWSAQHPDDWRKTWQLLEDKWNKDDVCPDGALSSFNIDAKLNGAYVALGLLYGGKDVGRTMEVAARSGQDSDCNPSSAAGILGVMIGYDKLPALYRSGIPAMADLKFEFTNYSFNSIVASTMVRAEKVIASAGGTVTSSEVVIPAQAPTAPPLEQWNAGVPLKRVAITDPVWTWTGGWTTEAVQNEAAPYPRNVRRSAKAGDEATVTFDGTGVVIAGTYSQAGGRADVYLDGAKAGTIDAWIPARTYDTDLFHVMGLAPGPHRLRLVTLGDADMRSTGKTMEVVGAVVYGKK